MLLSLWAFKKDMETGMGQSMKVLLAGFSSPEKPLIPGQRLLHGSHAQRY